MKLLRGCLVLILLVIAAACSQGEGGQAGEGNDVATPADDLLDGADATQPPSPTPTQDPFRNAVMRIVGEEEMVFDWTSDRCTRANIPDMPSRAYRNADGEVRLVISETTGYAALGSDLNTLSMDCEPINTSPHQADPGLFSDNQWIASPYTEDGVTVYALVHNEYQGHTHPGQCPSGDYFSCWYNAVTMMVSYDGGRHFKQAAEPPGHLVASLPYPYEPDEGVYGMFSPSNIVKGPEGYYYSFVKHQAYGTHNQTTCLMRTDNLADPASWRFWDGSAFEGVFANPYTDDVSTKSEHICAPVALNEIGAQLVESLTYNTYLERYVLVGISADHIDGREVWGFFYSFSFDLIHWTRRQLLVEMPLPWTVEHHSNTNFLYPSLLDPESLSLSFESTGKTAYLYYTRHNFGQGSLDRDLIRVRVEFFPSAGEAP